MTLQERSTIRNNHGKTKAFALLVTALTLISLATVAPWLVVTLLAIFLFLTVPLLGVTALIAGDAIALPVIMLFPNVAPLLPWLTTGAFLLSVMNYATKSARVRARLMRTMPSIVLVVTWGVLVGHETVGGIQLLTGVRFMLVPILMGVIAPALTKPNFRLLLNIAGLLLIASAMAALLQNLLGADALVASGLQYGGAVRTVDSVLRPPGLFVASYVYGAYASVSALLFLGALVSSETRQPMYWVYLAAAVCGTALSTSRFALLILVFGAALLLLTSGKKLPGVVRISVPIVVYAVIYTFVSGGLSGTDSWSARVELWLGIGSRLDFGLGSGIGSAGSATLSQFSSHQNTVDNYFLSLVYQLGVVGMALSLVAIVLTVVMCVRARHLSGLRLGGAAAFVGVVASFAVTETWEYTSSVSLMLAALFSSLPNSDVLASRPQNTPELI